MSTRLRPEVAGDPYAAISPAFASASSRSDPHDSSSAPQPPRIVCDEKEGSEDHETRPERSRGPFLRALTFCLNSVITSRYPNDAHNSYFYAPLPIRVQNQMRITSRRRRGGLSTLLPLVLALQRIRQKTPSPRQAQYLLTRRAEPGLPLLELPAYCLARP